MQKTKLLAILLFLLASLSLSAQEKQTEMEIYRNSIEFKQDSLAAYLCQMYGFDQGIRNMDMYDGVRGDFVTKTAVAVDSINFYKFIEFVKEHGYPRKEILGEKNMQHLNVKAIRFVILAHNPHRVIQPEIYELMKSEVKKGHLSAELLSYSLDRYYVHYKGYSLFNTYYKNFLKTNKGVCRHRQEESNRARLDIGLEVLPDSVFIDCKPEIETAK